MGQLAEPVGGAARRGLGPQQGQQLLPGDPSLAGPGEDRKERERLALGRGAGQPDRRCINRWGAQESQSEQRRRLTPF